MSITMESISQTFSSGVMKPLPAWRTLLVLLRALQLMSLRAQPLHVTLSSQGIYIQVEYFLWKLTFFWKTYSFFEVFI